MKHMTMLALVSAFCLAVSAGTGTNELWLADNVTIHVAAGDTFTITNLTGYGWRLTKTGPGTLEIYAISNQNAKITIEEGTLEMANPVPDVLADAFFHADASAASSLETTLIDGTNFVTRWNDVRGDGFPYATNVGKNAHMPFINSSHPGRNVVDFGTTWNATNTTGYGAAMKWSHVLDRPMDVFVVEQHNEDMRATVLDGAARGITGNTAFRNQALLGANKAGLSTAYGSNADQTLIPGNPEVGYDSCAIVAGFGVGHTDLAFKFRVDCGAEMSTTVAKSYHPGYDWHVYGFYPTGQNYLTDKTRKTIINTFAMERSNVFGGQRIAECVAFNTLLTASQRDAVNRYLCLKWKPTALTGSFAELVAKSGTAISLPDGNMLAPKIFIDEGAAVTGCGTFAPNTTISGGSISATSGSVVYDPLFAADAWFHVDAAQTNLLGISSSAPTNIYCWSDLRGRKSKNGGDEPGDAGRYAWYKNSSFPFLNFNYLNGLPVMDFGPIWVEGDGDTPSGRKRTFQWSEICEAPRHFLMVVGDNEDAKLRSIDATTDHQKRNQAFIGNYSCTQTSSARVYNPIFGRANRTDSTVNSAYYISSSIAGTPSVRCDGQDVATPQSTPFPDGMHLVTIRPYESLVASGDQRCNAFASERGHLYGGQRIAECLVFTNELATSERDLLEGLLMAKWFASNGVVRTYANVTVASNASLEMKYQRVAVTGKLTMGGTLKSERVQVGDAATIELTAPSTIDGTLALPESDAATVTLAGDAWGNYFGETVKILGATAVTGRKPVGVIDPNPHHVTVAFSIGADGLYATFNPTGTYIIFR